MARWFEAEEIERSTAIALVLGLTCSAAVLYHSARAWRKLREEQEWRLPQILRGRNVVLSTLLATLTAVAAIVAYAGPKDVLTVQPTPNGPRVSVQVPALWVAILSVVVLSVVICVNAYVIYLTAYVGCSAILNKPVARWKRRLMRLYLLAVMVLWLLEIVYQVEVRRSAASLPGSTRSFFLSITWIMITFVGHIFFFGVFSVAAISNLNSSAEATDQHLAPDALAELRPLAVRSVVYIALSIVLYILVWLATILRPLDLQIDVTTTPYCLAITLLCYGCFVAFPLASDSAAPPVDVQISLEEHTSAEVELQTVPEAVSPPRRRNVAVSSPRRRNDAAMHYGSPVTYGSPLQSGLRPAGAMGTPVRPPAGVTPLRISGTTGFPSLWDDGYLTQSLPPSVASDRASKGSNSNEGSSAGSEFKAASGSKSNGSKSSGSKSSKGSSSSSAGHKSRRSGSSSLSSKTASSGEAAVTAIAISSSPGAPGSSGAGQGGGRAASYSSRQGGHWVDLFRNQGN